MRLGSVFKMRTSILNTATTEQMGCIIFFFFRLHEIYKSKVIILLTDGTNNKGDISPLTAAEIAKSFGIRVYTIGVGTNGMAPYPYPVGNTVQYVSMPVEIDEKTLTEIAGTTDGNYFRATSNSKLKEVYEEIDKLEKTKLNVKEYSKRDEEYHWFALAAFLCVLLEVLLRNSVLKKIP